MTAAMSTPTLDDVLRQRAQERGDRTALVFRGETCSYRGLDERADRIAEALRRAGAGPGARIATLDKNHAAHFELLFAASRTGAVLVPISFRLAATEIELILREAEPVLLFVGTEYRALIEELRDRLPRPPRIVLLDGEGPAGYAAFCAADPSASAAPAAAHRPTPDTIVLQLYTSGTTGLPKGVLLSHLSLIELMDRARLHLGTWRDDDVSLLCMPLFHIGGTGWGLIGLHCGLPTHLLREAEPGAILSAVAEHGVTKIFLVPALLLFLLQHPRFAQTELRSLRHIVYGASPIAESLLRRALAHFPCELGQVYGLTETCGTITYLGGEDHKAADPVRMRSCGRPLPGIQIRIVGPDGEALPPGEIGEVVCRTGQLMQGYYKQPEATAEVLRDGWFHSGDAGYFDEAGYLYIHDRVKDMIISGGENIYPAEIESALSLHPAVADVAVIGVPDPVWGESVLACVVLRPGTPATETELIEFARGRISRFKVPRRITFVPSLPRNAAGKLLKRELRAPYWQGQSRQVH